MPNSQQVVEKKNAAIEAFNRKFATNTGEHFIRSINSGLGALHNLASDRILCDTQELFGIDSMMVPASPVELELRVARELEAYLIAESAAFMERHSGGSNEDWYLNWLGELRLGEKFRGSTQDRALQYTRQSAGDRRLKFASRIDRLNPAATRIPLVLYRLLPLAVHGATAVALVDMLAASEIRNEQAKLLPSIVECAECHGRPLDNGEICVCCHNPLWQYAWLQATD